MYASHTTLSNIFSSPYEAPIVFPVHRCMLCNACIPIHHYSTPQEAVRESTHRVRGVRQCYFVSTGHYVNDTADPQTTSIRYSSTFNGLNLFRSPYEAPLIQAKMLNAYQLCYYYCLFIAHFYRIHSTSLIANHTRNQVTYCSYTLLLTTISMYTAYHAQYFFS